MAHIVLGNNKRSIKMTILFLYNWFRLGMFSKTRNMLDLQMRMMRVSLNMCMSINLSTSNSTIKDILKCKHTLAAYDVSLKVAPVNF